MSHVFKCMIFGVVFVSGPAFAFFGLFEPNVEPVKEYLKDPYSAKFEDVKDYGAGVICGNVNSKNEFGAYTGKRAFAIQGGTVYFPEKNPAEYKLACVQFVSCVNLKRESSADACLEAVTKRETEQKEAKRKELADNRNNPKNAKLRKYGVEACEDWRKGSIVINSRINDLANQCKVAVNSCVNNHAQDGYMNVAACINKINMISDKSALFIYRVEMDKN